ncbi:MAG: hypothetical protein QT08_C0010G0034 [archaeon GW2011_AR17]|nr:MAG: hypothetical protein QT08_C0010G0034 [archaeon GW2011_AR17]MBS3154320.1 hypothetical protein [Candidatus Woesearchaeota archaeon]HIH58587.1 hypothetical protein [Nanoarchaeota archaeon]
MTFFETIKKICKAVYVIIVSFFEALTVSFYKNVKKRYEKPSNEYVEVKVPQGYKDKKIKPEYKDLSETGEFSDFTGFPGLK